VEWVREARCKQHDPDVFFAQGAAEERLAVQVCRSCSVQEQCLAYALTSGIEFGVWGGLTENQRRQLIRDRVAG
jgi:WhiB family transcriptional regulator, redox-sensing transcriptional regulator